MIPALFIRQNNEGKWELCWGMRLIDPEAQLLATFATELEAELEARRRADKAKAAEIEKVCTRQRQKKCAEKQ